MSLVGVLLDVRGHGPSVFVGRKIQSRIAILFQINGAAPLIRIMGHLTKYSQLGQLRALHGELTVPGVSVVNNRFHGLPLPS